MSGAPPSEGAPLHPRLRQLFEDAAPDAQALSATIRRHWGRGMPTDRPAQLLDLCASDDRLRGPDGEALDPEALSQAIRNGHGCGATDNVPAIFVAWVDGSLALAERRQLMRLSEELGTSVHVVSIEAGAAALTVVEPSPGSAALRGIMRCHADAPAPTPAAAAVCRAVATIDYLRFGAEQAHSAKMDTFRTQVRPALAELLAIARSDEPEAADAQAVLFFAFPELDPNGRPARPFFGGPRLPALARLLYAQPLTLEERLDLMAKSLNAADTAVLRTDRVLPPSAWEEDDEVFREAVRTAEAAVAETLGARESNGGIGILNPYCESFIVAALRGDIAAIWDGFGLGNTRSLSVGMPHGVAGFLLAALQAARAVNVARESVGLEPLDIWTVLSLGDADIQANVRMWIEKLEQGLAAAGDDVPDELQEALDALDGGLGEARQRLLGDLEQVTDEAVSVLGHFSSLAQERFGVTMDVNLSSIVAHEPAYQLLHQALLAEKGPFGHMTPVEREYFAAQLAEQMTYLAALGAFDTPLVKLAWEWLGANTEMAFNDATRDVFGDDSLIDVVTRADIGRFGSAGSPYFHTREGDPRTLLRSNIDTILDLLDIASPRNPRAHSLANMQEIVDLWEEIIGPLTAHKIPPGYREVYPSGDRTFMLHLPADVLAEKLSALGQWLTSNIVPSLDTSKHTKGARLALEMRPPGVRRLFGMSGFENNPLSLPYDMRMEWLTQQLDDHIESWIPVRPDERSAWFQFSFHLRTPAGRPAHAVIRSRPLGLRLTGHPLPGILNERLANWSARWGVAVAPIKIVANEAMERATRRDHSTAPIMRGGTFEVWLPENDRHIKREMLREQARISNDRIKLLALRPGPVQPAAPAAIPAALAETAAREWTAAMRAWEDAGRVEEPPVLACEGEVPQAPFEQWQAQMQEWWLYRSDPKAAVAQWRARTAVERRGLSLMRAEIDLTLSGRKDLSLEEAVVIAVAPGIDRRLVESARKHCLYAGLEAYAGWVAVGGAASIKLSGESALQMGQLHIDSPYALAYAHRRAIGSMPTRGLTNGHLLKPGMLHPMGVVVERIAHQMGGVEAFSAALGGDEEAVARFDALAAQAVQRLERDPAGFLTEEPAWTRIDNPAPRVPPAPRRATPPLASDSVQTVLCQQMSDALAALGLDRGFVRALGPAPAHFGDFQLHLGAVAASAAVSPAQMAERLQAQLAMQPEFEQIARVEVVGPYLNLRLTDACIAERLERMRTDPRLDVPQLAEPIRTLVDMLGINAAKEMHVGHLRSTGLGDLLSRVFEFVGYEVHSHNHLGDWGTPFGMLFGYVLDRHEDMEGLQIGRLGDIYRGGKVLFDEDPDFRNRALQLVARLQDGDQELIALWRRMVDVSLEHVDDICAQLGVIRPEPRGESTYNDLLPGLVEELLAGGFAQESEGAVVMYLDGFNNMFGQPQGLLLRKSMGGYLYATTDIAALRHRVQVLGAQRLVYVIGLPQARHIAMVEAAAHKGRLIPPDAHIELAGFGSILGRDGKPYKTRSGESFKLVELLSLALERALAHLQARIERKNSHLAAKGLPLIDASGPALQQTAEQLARAVIRFSDVARTRNKDYRFDPDGMLDFDGSPVVDALYAHLRASRLQERARSEGVDTEPPIPQGAAAPHWEPAERELAVELMRLGDVLHRIADRAEPHWLAGYLDELSKRFSRFYAECPVFGTPDAPVDPERTRVRLQLAELARRTLGQCVQFLGVEAEKVTVM
jgi:arginyl-tRNA synthetase